MTVTDILMPALSIGGMGLIFGLGLGIAGVKLKIEEDERLALIRTALPGANCGGCGFVGCEAYAAAVVNGEAGPGGCPVGGPNTAAEVAAIMGVDAHSTHRISAFIKCGGSCAKSRANYQYEGMKDCTAISHLAGGGQKLCAYGCLGGGNCIKACAFDAINLVDGIAVVDNQKCTSCGKCVDTCPKRLIELVPYNNLVRVNCNSNDNGKTTKLGCDVGCIGCKLCEKACKFDAVHVENMLAKVDYNKCTHCNECVQKCPTKAITSADTFDGTQAS